MPSPLRAGYDRLFLRDEFSRSRTPAGITPHLLVLGEGLKGGGLMHGKWPALNTEAMDADADLSTTTDCRAVLCDVLASRMGMAKPHELFPNYGVSERLGIA